MSDLPLIGILGGTFNPVHIGHLRLASAMAEAFDLTRVELMPCAVPPHKSAKGILPFDLRVALLQAALDDTGPDARAADKLIVSTLENELPPPSYTWNLLHVWRERHPDERPLFILGGEDFNQLDTWRHGLQLPSVAHFAVVPRADAHTDEEAFYTASRRLWPDAMPVTGGRRPFPCMRLIPESDSLCFFVPLPYLDISASFLRSRWLSQQSLRSLTPDAVVDLMETHKEALIQHWNDDIPSNS